MLHLDRAPPRPGTVGATVCRPSAGEAASNASGYPRLSVQVWELTYALEKRVQLPLVDLPGFAGGEVDPGTELPHEPAAAARALRAEWGLGNGPVTHLVRRLETHGIVVVTPQRDNDLQTVDAFSTSRLPRPVIVLTPNRADDVYRHRFTTAHELGHLVLHSEATGDTAQEREADMFAAEFLTPRDSILPELPARADLHKLSRLRESWACQCTICSTDAGNSDSCPTRRLAAPTNGCTPCGNNPASVRNP